MSEREEIEQAFGLQLQDYTDDIAVFLVHFEDLCTVAGGLELKNQVQQEIHFQLSRGADMLEAITPAYERIRKLVI